MGYRAQAHLCEPFLDQGMALLGGDLRVWAVVVEEHPSRGYEVLHLVQAYGPVPQPPLRDEGGQAFLGLAIAAAVGSELALVILV